MSNDSNERGHDTAAQAFQAGDRVRFDWYGTEHEGVLAQIDDNGWVRVQCEYAGYHPHLDALTLISRATPAPAQTARPTVVCLCGSTRFSEAFREANLRETLAGRIVLSIGCDMRSDTEIFGGMRQSELDEIKRRLDELHKRKIDLADEILVLNVGGYVGESTRGEIAHAREHGKRIRYLEVLDTEEPADSEPATPAPAVRASGAVDTHTLELPVRVTCCRCDGDGVLVLDDEGLTEQCGLCHGVGWTTDTILLSDNAVDRLAAALAPLLVKRMVHDIRMIANDRP